MDRPLGLAIGNALEVAEAINVLKGDGPQDLTQVCIELASNMLMHGGKGTMETCRRLAANALADGSAMMKLVEMIKRQGGDPGVAEDPSRLPKAPIQVEWKADISGYIHSMQAEKLGMASMVLGAGRKTKTDVIDPSSGIVLLKKAGDRIDKGEPLAILHTSVEETIAEATSLLYSSIRVQSEPVEQRPLILGRVE
jgi:pyrimidine-nucleoside phosphorylase